MENLCYFWEGRYGERAPVGWPIATPQESDPAWFLQASIQDTLALLLCSLAKKLLWSMRALTCSFHAVGEPGMEQQRWANLPGFSIGMKPLGLWWFMSVDAAVSPLSTSVANSLTTSKKKKPKHSSLGLLGCSGTEQLSEVGVPPLGVLQAVLCHLIVL